MSADHENDTTPHGMADFGGADPRMQGPANSGTETSSSDLEKAWGRVTERLRRDIGDAAWRNWIKPLRVSRLQDGTLTLEAGSSLARDRVSSQYADRLRVISAAEYGAENGAKHGSVKQIEVKLAASAITENRRRDNLQQAAETGGRKAPNGTAGDDLTAGLDPR